MYAIVRVKYNKGKKIGGGWGGGVLGRDRSEL